jgi:hypothetical protein
MKGRLGQFARPHLTFTAVQHHGSYWGQSGHIADIAETT